MISNISKQYIDYIEKHCANVTRGYRWLLEHLPQVIANPKETRLCVATHDESKWTDAEFNAYAQYFYGEHTEEKQAEVDYDFDVAWNHHQKCNPHHWQYWVLRKDSGEDVFLDMPDCYIIEMICDWWAFSWAEDNLYEIFKWYDTHKEDIKLSDNTREKLENILSQMERKLKELE